MVLYQDHQDIRKHLQDSLVDEISDKRGSNKDKKAGYWKQKKLERKNKKQIEADAKIAKELARTQEVSQSEAERGNVGIECQVCCSVDVEAVNITMCRDGHVFCKDCAKHMAEIQLGARKCHLPCMAAEVSHIERHP